VPVETVLLFVFGVVIFIIGLVISVALHELGHLSFAKLFGVRVSQYMVGFGKTLWSFKRGETEYGIKAVLLGGYISMAGMFPPRKTADGEIAKQDDTRNRAFFRAVVQDARDASAATMDGTDESRAFYNASPWKRIIIMVAGPFMNLLIGIAITAVLICGFGAPVATIATVGACVPTDPTGTSKCVSTDAPSPAKVAGIKKGDVLISVKGVKYPSTAQATALIQQSANQPITLVVLRGGHQVTITTTPVKVKRDELDASGVPMSTTEGQPIVSSLGAIGVGLGDSLIPQPITAVLPTAGAQVGSTFAALGKLPTNLVGVWNAVFTSAPRAPGSPVSVVGVGRAIGTVSSMTGVPVKDKVYTILGLLASLNFALFALNMLPLLPLDGGHVVGALWEAIRNAFARLFGRKKPGPVDIARAMPITYVVVAIFVAMSALLIVADLIKPVSLTG
jgi:membrane-associated protease RseP (regulator of RpoE activity)